MPRASLTQLPNSGCTLGPSRTKKPEASKRSRLETELLVHPAAHRCQVVPSCSGEGEEALGQKGQLSWLQESAHRAEIAVWSPDYTAVGSTLGPVHLPMPRMAFLRSPRASVFLVVPS